ncbi:MAG: Bax inhibitor-1 family protein [Planctomycetota bacterium]
MNLHNLSNVNPYSGTAAAHADADARASFLQRTYSLLLGGVFVFAATLWAAGNVEPVRDLALGLARGGWLICMAVIVGGGIAVRWLADRHPINLVAYFAYAFAFGLLLAPIVLFTAAVEPRVLTQAAIVTGLVFTGLTGYVFVSRKDFSFLGGALAIGAFALLGLLFAGWMFGFELGLWFSVAGVLIYAGFILYDTSRILHHYPPTAHVRAAIELFVSLIMLFQYVLHLLMSLNND